MCPGTYCSNLVGKPGHLDRALTIPMEVGWDRNNGAQWYLQPQRNPAVSRELLCLPNLLYTVSLLFVVQKVVLYRSNLCVGFMCQVVLRSRSWPGAYSAQGTGLLGWSGSWQGSQGCVVMPCCSCLLPCSEAKGSRQCSWEFTAAVLQPSCSQGKVPEWSSPSPVYGSGRGCKQGHPTAPLTQGVLQHSWQLPEGSFSFPAISTHLFLLFVVQKLFIWPSVVS